MNFEKSIRVVNAKHFRWVEGMLAHIPDNGSWHTIRLTPPVAENWNSKQNKDCLPDIEDPATIGCMLELVGEQFDVDTLIDALGAPSSDVA